MRLDILKAMNAARAARLPSVLVTDLALGEQRFVLGDGLESDPLRDELEKALHERKSATIDVGGRTVFLTVQAPPPRLIIVGAAHITQALAPMARLTGFDMTVVDPRTAFASSERFPDVALIAEWPDVALPRIGLDPFTGLACFTHDPKIDDPALEMALRAKCFYIGALGSKKTHARRVERLSAIGFTQQDIARIHAPIGLDIGAVSPAEIAVSVLGEIILSMRKKPLRMVREAAA